MKKFIEVHSSYYKAMPVIVNIDWIEQIVPSDESDGAQIFFSMLDSDDYQDNFETVETYDQIHSMIANIQGGFTVPPEMAKVGELE